MNWFRNLFASPEAKAQYDCIHNRVLMDMKEDYTNHYLWDSHTFWRYTTVCTKCGYRENMDAKRYYKLKENGLITEKGKLNDEQQTTRRN